VWAVFIFFFHDFLFKVKFVNFSCDFQVRHWLWLLDSRLPPPMGEVGHWLARAERLILSDATEIPSAMNEETASVISRKLEEHKVYHGMKLMKLSRIPA